MDSSDSSNAMMRPREELLAMNRERVSRWRANNPCSAARQNREAKERYYRKGLDMSEPLSADFRKLSARISELNGKFILAGGGKLGDVGRVRCGGGG
jgi:hypothetical protein